MLLRQGNESDAADLTTRAHASGPFIKTGDDECDHHANENEEKNNIPFGEALNGTKYKSASFAFEFIPAAGIVKQVGEESSEEKHQESGAVVTNLDRVKPYRGTTFRARRWIVSI